MKKNLSFLQFNILVLDKKNANKKIDNYLWNFDYLMRVLLGDNPLPDLIEFTDNKFWKIQWSYNSTISQIENYKNFRFGISWKMYLHKQMLFLKNRTLSLYNLATGRHNYQRRFAINGLLILPNCNAN